MRKSKIKEKKSAQIAGEIKNKEKIKHNKTHVDIIQKQIAYIKSIDTNIFYAITNAGATSLLIFKY